MPSIEEVKASQILEANVQDIWRSQVTNDREPAQYRDYRSISSWGVPEGGSELPIVVQEKMQNICLWLYQSNPIAHRYVEMIKDYVVGDGMHYEAEDKRVQEYLDAMWEHPDNKLYEKLPLYVADLSIQGELLLQLQMEGDLLRLPYLNPSWISSVEVDPSDLSRFVAVNLKSDVVTKGSPRLTLLNVGKKGYREGDALFLPINRVGDAKRGISDLLPLADVIGNLDLFLFNITERARFMNNWFYDIKYEGANDNDLKNYYRQILLQKTFPGAMRLHNEKVTWDIKAPNLESNDSKELFNSIFSMLATGLGWPPHWTGLGMTGARAGAENSTDPAYHMLTTRQALIKSFLTDIGNFYIDQLLRKGSLKRPKSRKFKILAPRIAIRDLQRLGGAISRVIATVTNLVEKDIYTKEEAKQKIDELLDQISVK